MGEEHPIIALWCHPRSMSTATERIMRERGDLKCFHEPFLYDYYVNRAVRKLVYFDPSPDQPAAYEEVRKMLLDGGEAAPVFFKDMSYYVVPRIFEDAEFVRRLTNIFLIRDPRRAIVSYHKLDPDVTMEEIGLTTQLAHVEWLEKITGKTPYVVEAETIQENPVFTISALWEKIGLSPKPGAFSWSSEEVPEGWGEVAGWHGSVLASTGITSNKTVSPAEEVFETHAAKHPHLREYLDIAWPAYEALQARVSNL